MRFLVAILALLPALATAQTDLGTYQITSGELAGSNANLVGAFAGNGFTGSLYGYPLPMLNGQFVQGETDFSMAISPPAGRDQGLYLSSISGPINLSHEGLIPYSGFTGIEESGELSTRLIDITGAGAYTTSFTMSADVDYGAPGATSPAGYVNFVGSGTLTVDIGQACTRGVCGPMYVSYADYSFARAPELDAASVGGALTLLAGGLLVLRGRRSRAR
jgi:hypothetical protein